MPNNNDFSAQQINSSEDGAPEYLSTEWSVTSTPPITLRQVNAQSMTETVWKTGVHLVNPITDDKMSTFPLPPEGWDAPILERDRPSHRRVSKANAGRRLFLWLIAMLAILGIFGAINWNRPMDKLRIIGLTATARPETLTCNQSTSVVAKIDTNGAPGSIRYLWVRSDGTDSGLLHQTVYRGQREVKIPLYWNFHGRGIHKIVATVEILSPAIYTASAPLTYRCMRASPVRETRSNE